LINFLNTNNIITNHHIDFRSGLSADLASNELRNYILRLNDSAQYTYAIFLDLKKAFDTVNHKIFLNKLNHYGICGLASNLFASYVENKQQFVYANGFQSDKMKITCGVPQGSTLDTVLLLLYIDDLPLSSNFFVIFLLMTQHYLFQITILPIWRKNLMSN